jgi:Zn-dependent protease
MQDSYSAMAIPQPNQVKARGVSFSTDELISILVSMVTMVLAFQMFGVSEGGIILGVVFGITLHEVGHKIVAQSMGFHSKYKLWEIGLLLVVAFAIISRGKFIFAAPGFVVTEGDATPRDEGIIALSAPATNILLAALFLIVGTNWASSAAYVNVLLAVFNLLPIDPLDGGKVLRWSQIAWYTSFGAALFLGLLLII